MAREREKILDECTQMGRMKPTPARKRSKKKKAKASLSRLSEREHTQIDRGRRETEEWREREKERKREREKPTGKSRGFSLIPTVAVHAANPLQLAKFLSFRCLKEKRRENNKIRRPTTRLQSISVYFHHTRVSCLNKLLPDLIKIVLFLVFFVGVFLFS